MSNKQVVRQLGDYIGYGNLMQLASEIWGEKLAEMNLKGGEFRVGPCVSGTVECLCVQHRNRHMSTGCNWCNGAGWVTKHVSTVQKNMAD